MPNLIHRPIESSTIIGCLICTAVSIAVYVGLGIGGFGYQWSCDSVTEPSKLAACQAFVDFQPQLIEYIRMIMLAIIPCVWVLGLIVVPRYMKKEGQNQP